MNSISSESKTNNIFCYNWLQGSRKIPEEISCKIVSNLSHVDAWSFSQACRDAQRIKNDMTVSNAYLNRIGYVQENIQESNQMMIAVIDRVKFLHSKGWLSDIQPSPFEYLDNTPSENMVSVICPWTNEWSVLKENKSLGIDTNRLRNYEDISTNSEIGQYQYVFLRYYGENKITHLTFRALQNFIDKFGLNTTYGRIKCSFLHAAVELDRTEIVEFLVNAGAQINILNHQRMTALHLAAFFGFDSTVSVLIDAGAEIDENDGGGFSVIYLATQNNHIGTVRLLISKNADVDQANLLCNYTPLMIAAKKGYFTVIQMLLKAGCKFNKVDSNGDTALHIAVMWNQVEVVEELIDAGADVNLGNKKGETPLSIASAKNFELVELLVDAGANINQLDENGLSPIFQAVISNKYACVEFLLDCNAKINGLRDSKGSSLLSYAIVKGCREICSLLIQNKADIDEHDNEGNTPLLLSINQKVDDKYPNFYFEVISRLIRAGADVSKANNKNETPLLTAISVNNRFAVKSLLKAGANIDVADLKGRTALMIAAKKDWIEGIELLMKSGAEVNLEDKYGWTALMYATEWKSTEAVELLNNLGGIINETPKKPLGSRRSRYYDFLDNA